MDTQLIILIAVIAVVAVAVIGFVIVRSRGDSTLWEATLGGRVGLLRYGSFDCICPEGFQIDAEGSAQVRQLHRR